MEQSNRTGQDEERCLTCHWLLREWGMKEFQEPKDIWSCGHPNAEQGCPYTPKDEVEERCKNCQYWVVEHRCTCPKFNYVSSRFSKGAEPENDGILIEFDEMWGAICGPDFGCIHFHRRGAEQ